MYSFDTILYKQYFIDLNDKSSLMYGYGRTQIGEGNRKLTIYKSLKTLFGLRSKYILEDISDINQQRSHWHCTSRRLCSPG